MKAKENPWGTAGARGKKTTIPLVGGVSCTCGLNAPFSRPWKKKGRRMIGVSKKRCWGKEGNPVGGGLVSIKPAQSGGWLGFFPKIRGGWSPEREIH